MEKEKAINLKNYIEVEKHLKWLSEVFLYAKANTKDKEWENVCKTEERVRQIILKETGRALPIITK